MINAALAKRFHSLSRIDRKVFDQEYEYRGQKKNLLDKFSDRLGRAENSPFLGYIGKNYFDQKTKVVFVGKAGGESSSSDQNCDLFFHEKFLEFQSSPGQIQDYLDYNEITKLALSRWKIMIYINFFLFGVERDLDSIAFCNIVPFRYRGSPTKRVMKIAFENYTSDFLNLVQADMIIPLGGNLTSSIHDLWKSTYHGKIIMAGIPRTNGDTWIDDRGSDCLNLCIKDHLHIRSARLKLVK
tara:strand:+ start:67 stop:789 length:723 start_codon:yes stop_codon:yes gene_type:complete